MRATDRQRLIEQGLKEIKASHPATLTFAGFPPVPAARHTLAATAALRLGGFTGSAPQVFLVLKTDIPAGLVLREKSTRFRVVGETADLRIDTLDASANEPHVRITTDLADR